MAENKNLTEQLTTLLRHQANLNDEILVRLSVLEIGKSRWLMFFVIVFGAVIGNIIAGFLP